MHVASRLGILACAALATAASACSKEEPSAPSPSPAAEAAPSPTAEPVPAAPPATPEPAALAAQAASEEACGQILVVAYRGAAHAAPSITRDKDAAKARAGELLAKLAAGADFAALAKEHSDAPTSAPIGGIMGTFARSEWPPIHQPLEATVFSLEVGAFAPAVVEVPYGFVLVRRCPVEKAHSRHVLVRFAGAKNAGPEVTRTKQEAFARATQIQRRATSGEGFASLARAGSEDSSAERGGDIGTWGRGRLSAAYEEALFALRDGGISIVVESENGYHVIQRLPLDPALPPQAAPAPASAAGN